MAPQDLLNDINSVNIKSLQLINEVKSRIDFGKIIGTYINSDGQAFQTTKGMLIYSKSGVHIYPIAPN
jgi:Bacterial toxin 50